jgi:hypothetical protein
VIETGNPISGRHPISILLYVLGKSKFTKDKQLLTKLVRYG